MFSPEKNNRSLGLIALAIVACAREAPEAATPAHHDSGVVVQEPASLPFAPTEIALDEGTIVSLSLGAEISPHQLKGQTGVEFTIGSTRVSVSEWFLFPEAALDSKGDNGPSPRRAEQDGEHSALVAASPESNLQDVFGFAPGLLCSAQAVAASDVDAVFSVCSSMRRVGGVVSYAKFPEVERTLILGQPAVEVSGGQFTGAQMEDGGELDCNNLLESIDYGREARKVETLTLTHGKVRVWWSVDDDEGEHLGQSKVFAIRGKYCCGFELRPWFEPASRSDLEALAHVCDNAAQPDWPNAYLPPPRPVGE